MLPIEVAGIYDESDHWLYEEEANFRLLVRWLEQIRGSRLDTYKQGVVVRRVLAHYYPPTETEFEQLWTKGAIVLDTNVLLNLYRYSDASRTEFAAVLQALALRLWIPHQVAFEFHKNRVQVINEQLSAFDSVVRKLSNAREAFEREMNAFRRNEAIDVATLIARHESVSTELIELVNAAKCAHPQLSHNADEDPTAIMVTTLFEDRVGEPFEDGPMKQLCEEGVCVINSL